MNRLPAPNTLLRDLPLPDLRPETRALIQRISACLYVVSREENQARAILAGYTPHIHGMGVFLASVALGERPFWEWRLWRSLRPLRDPELPEMVTELSRFADRWLSEARSAIANLPDADDRRELSGCLDAQTERKSRTWRAKSIVAMIEGFAKVPAPFYQDTWAALVAQGIEAELPRFHEVLGEVQRHIEGAPLDTDELAEIQEARESGGASVGRWLDERRTQFAGRFSDETLTLLGLGDIVPPPMPPEISIHVLDEFRAAAQA